MTTTETTASRELDARVAVHIFGWEWMRRKSDGMCALFAPEGGDWDTSLIRPSPAWEKCDGTPPTELWMRGWDRASVRAVEGRYGQVDYLPCYSSDIGAAWEIVEEMRKRGGTLVLAEYKTGVRWEADFGITNAYEPVKAETAPLAIVLGALSALGVEVTAEDAGRARRAT